MFENQWLTRPGGQPALRASAAFSSALGYGAAACAKVHFWQASQRSSARAPASDVLIGAGGAFLEEEPPGCFGRGGRLRADACAAVRPS